MSSSLENNRFNTEDPTVWLWKKLLRSKSLSYTKPKLSKADKKAISVKLQTYYSEHSHPRKGMQPGK